MNVIENIDGELRRRKISQAAMCQQVGIPLRTFQNWHHKGDLKVSDLLRIADFLSCKPEYLLRKD